MSDVDVQDNAPESSDNETGGVTGSGFKKGRSGNPGGQPLWVKAVRESLRNLAPKAVTRLEQIILSGEDKDANAAIKIALIFSVRKPQARVKVSGQVGNPLVPVSTEDIQALIRATKGEGK